MARLPLEGVKVLDVSTMIAAPFGAVLLGDFGADVIKVELPGKGDTLRHVGPFKDGEPLRWPGLARNKRSLTLDLRKEGGGYEELKRINPKLVMIRVSGYGQTGPFREKDGFGTPATAFSGFTYLQGYPDRPPVSPILSIKDIFEHPHYQARENIIEVAHPRLGKIKMPGIVPKFEKTPGAIRRTAPDLGEHTEEILQTMLGMSKEDIERLRENEII
ncbi:CoA transferase [Geobacillus stearothermophilus]|uniref:L-carnitine dehydratase/bile acid-inducible protein F n=1 Tax=Geobacillus stearothermophilus TaxID=1422 RepID=A0A150MT67_GEOSE|nr:CoA transferase [Geobacillus stearothermophilus]KYD27532.1 L-carnitine dehydratase/bile acid-inducible protein F [Geobacillus stearothermophilus]MED3843656.1 CoA transferase [Geobacillus stearothermophilus]MED4355164.1 CoA transferase [Geobacillus stearothermophilus]MED5041319.1 CoA transferase [Geobacillus stearothermophilus]